MRMATFATAVAALLVGSILAAGAEPNVKSTGPVQCLPENMVGGKCAFQFVLSQQVFYLLVLLDKPNGRILVDVHVDPKWAPLVKAPPVRCSDKDVTAGSCTAELRFGEDAVSVHAMRLPPKRELVFYGM